MGFTSFLSISFNAFYILICLKILLLLVHNLGGFHPTHATILEPKGTTTRTNGYSTHPGNRVPKMPDQGVTEYGLSEPRPMEAHRRAKGYTITI